MSLNTELDGSEDVNDFLLRIRELGEKRDKEDEERTRKLEEDILQGRKEREARRAGMFRPARTMLVFNHRRGATMKRCANATTRTRQVAVSDKVLQRRHTPFNAVAFESARRYDEISHGPPAIGEVARRYIKRSFSKHKSPPRIAKDRQCWLSSKHTPATVKAY